IGSPAYRIALGYHTVGVATVFNHDHLQNHVQGVFRADRPMPLAFSSNSRLRGQDRVVTLIWRDGTPIVAALTPPNETEREDVPPASRANTIDPLSALALLLRQVARTGRCEASSRTYDGRRLQRFDSRTIGEE